MNNPRILVVEDEPITLINHVEILVELGYKTAGSAFSGEVAIELAERVRPDVVIMDIMLATSMSGLEAGQKIHSRFGIPIVFVSAWGQQVDEGSESSPPLGVRFIVKPFEKEQLAAAIEAVLAETTRPETS